MDNQKATKRILELFKFSDEKLNCLERVLALEEDKERIQSINLRLPEPNVNFIYIEKENPIEIFVEVRVYHEKWFANEEELTDYLNNHSLSDACIGTFEGELGDGAVQAYVGDWDVCFYKRSKVSEDEE